MNIDEPFHLNQSMLWINNFFYISDTDSGAHYTYGPLIGALLHVINVFLLNSKFTEFNNSPQTFEINHLGIALISFVTIYAFILLNNKIKSFKYIGFLSSIILLSIPLWVGNSLHNIKDIPSASGYTLLTVGCFLLINQITSNKYSFKNLLPIIIGLIILLGTRPALILPGFFTFLLTLIYLYLFHNIEYKKLIKVFLPTLFISLVAFFILLPHFLLTPIKSLKLTFLTSNSFPWNGLILTGGKLVEPSFNISYFFQWYFAQTPFIIWIFSLIGIFYYIFKIIRDPKSSLFIMSSLFFLQFFLLPIYLLITGSPIYNGLRHILFIYPSIAFFAALGIIFLYQKFELRKNFIIVIALIGIVIPNLEGIRLLPYQQIYYNPLISLFYKVSTQWETEYYGISAREAFWHLPKNGDLTKTSDWVWPDPAFLQERGKKAENKALSKNEYWLISGIYSYIDGDSRQRMLKSNSPLEALKPACSIEYVVTRKLRRETIPMSFISRCGTSGKLINGYASITWNTQTEVSQDQKPYIWLTSNGEIFRISNITSRTINRNFSFNLFANPCSTVQKFEISSENFNEIYNSPIVKDTVTKVKIPINIEPFKTVEVKIIPQNNDFCTISTTDQRKFVAGISSIDITD